MNPEQRAQPQCQEDEAIDAVTLLCAGAVDDYEIYAAGEPLSWYDATVECADDGAELIIGAGHGYNFDNGIWDFYRCADGFIGEVQNPPLMPDTALAPDDGIFGDNFGGVVVIVALVVLNLIGRRSAR